MHTSSIEKGKSGLISNLFEPLLGDKIKGPIGVIIDTLAVFATIAGIATSLGLGTLQINSGLSYLFEIDNNIKTQLIIIVITTVIFIWTAISGIDKAMKILSDINLITAVLITLAVLLIVSNTKDGELICKFIWRLHSKYNI